MFLRLTENIFESAENCVNGICSPSPIREPLNSRSASRTPTKAEIRHQFIYLIMTWSTSEIEYEGLPLLLRKPDHENIWRFKDKLTKLVSIEHHLDTVTSDGLPEKKYNSKLSDFDHYMCSLFDKSNDGIIFLIETYSGKRIYYYYTSPTFNIEPLIETTKHKFKLTLEGWTQDDTGWGFLDEYPVKLFPQ